MKTNNKKSQLETQIKDNAEYNACDCLIVMQ